MQDQADTLIQEQPVHLSMPDVQEILREIPSQPEQNERNILLDSATEQRKSNSRWNVLGYAGAILVAVILTWVVGAFILQRLQS